MQWGEKILSQNHRCREDRLAVLVTGHWSVVKERRSLLECSDCGSDRVKQPLPLFLRHRKPGVCAIMSCRSDSIQLRLRLMPAAVMQPARWRRRSAKVFILSHAVTSCTNLTSSTYLGLLWVHGLSVQGHLICDLCLSNWAHDNVLWPMLMLWVFWRITIRLSIFLTLARACDKRFSADHDTMLSLLIKAFGPWACTFYQTVFYRIFRREVAKTFSHSYFFRLLTLRNQRICMT